MPSYKTLVRILIATSVASSTVAAPIMSEKEDNVVPRSSGPNAPAPPEPAHVPATYPPAPVPARPADSPPDPATGRPRLMSPFVWTMALAASLSGTALGFLGGTLLTNSMNSHNRNRSVEDRGPISLSAANLSDEHLLFVRDISRSARALEVLD